MHQLLRTQKLTRTLKIKMRFSTRMLLGMAMLSVSITATKEKSSGAQAAATDITYEERVSLTFLEFGTRAYLYHLWQSYTPSKFLSPTKNHRN
mmetsp:Transcript_40057/g.60644  ORF Transcript_40057/g.60644 Transcript_40057/m.60644 type:complete len:93 (+) Transcript_40057:72-350(+)